MCLITCWVHVHAHIEEPREDVELPWAGTFLRFLFYTLKTEDQAVQFVLLQQKCQQRHYCFPQVTNTTGLGQSRSPETQLFLQPQ